MFYDTWRCIHISYALYDNKTGQVAEIHPLEENYYVDGLVHDCSTSIGNAVGML